MAGDSYNYESFSFALESDAYQAWLAKGPALGDAAPDFELADLQGRLHRLADLRGRPVVIEFGSYTCPIFCAQIPPMEAVAKGHPEAAMLVIYTREAHPGEVTPAHSNDEAKRQAALRLAAEEDLSRTLLVDDLEGSVHLAYGGAWDTVFVLDAAGRVVLRRAWNNPEDVEAALSTLRRDETPAPVESVDMVPVVGRGGMGHGLLRGGQKALFDFYQSAPPPVRQRLENSESDEVRRLVLSSQQASPADVASA